VRLTDVEEGDSGGARTIGLRLFIGRAGQDVGMSPVGHWCMARCGHCRGGQRAASSCAGDGRGGAGWAGGVERRAGVSNAGRGAPCLLDSRGAPAAWPMAKAARR
jgi:hypothetical protein